MQSPANSNLDAAIQAAVARIRRYSERGLGEQNTKASLIEPILESLGWDIRDPDEVHREFRPTGRDAPVDYALKIIRKPRLFLEAKGLGENLADRKWISQVLSYATVAGVEWCLLTDGDEYRVYNATAPLDAEEKLLCCVRLSKSEPAEAARVLSLLSRANLEENLLEVLWEAHFVDRRVKEALLSMIEGADKALVRLVRQKAPKLTAKEIVDSLRRLDVELTSPSPAPRRTGSPTAVASQPPRAGASAPNPKSKPKSERAKAAGDRVVKADYDASLADLIQAGLIRAPVELRKTYKGQQLTATLNRDGTIDFRGQNCRTCSTAAEAARAVVTGRRMNTNGWTFWSLQGSDGQARTLDDLRREFLAGGGRQ